MPYIPDDSEKKTKSIWKKMTKKNKGLKKIQKKTIK